MNNLTGMYVFVENEEVKIIGHSEELGKGISDGTIKIWNHSLDITKLIPVYRIAIAAGYPTITTTEYHIVKGSVEKPNDDTDESGVY